MFDDVSENYRKVDRRSHSENKKKDRESKRKSLFGGRKKSNKSNVKIEVTTNEEESTLNDKTDRLSIMSNASDVSYSSTKSEPSVLQLGIWNALEKRNSNQRRTELETSITSLPPSLPSQQQLRNQTERKVEPTNSSRKNPWKPNLEKTGSINESLYYCSADLLRTAFMPLDNNRSSNAVDDFESSDDESNEHSWKLPTRFSEPLYQVYSQEAEEEARKDIIIEHQLSDEETKKYYQDLESQKFETFDLVTTKSRTLWSNIPEVKESGWLQSLSKTAIKLQEAKFEILTSEASYLKSLFVLEKHFLKNIRLALVPKHLSEINFKILFGNVRDVRKSSEAFLKDLERLWEEDRLLNDIYKILETHAKNSRDIYMKYISQNSTMNDKFNELMKQNKIFREAQEILSQDRKAENLPLSSFLALPVSRITRFRLLMETVLKYIEDVNSEEYWSASSVLKTISEIAQECDEEIGRNKRWAEMISISSQLKFEDIHSIPLVQNGRHLVLRSSVKEFCPKEGAMKMNQLELFLFNDLLIVTKKNSKYFLRTSKETFKVIDYCYRKNIKAEVMDKPHLYGYSQLKESNPIILNLLSNHEGKKCDMIISFNELSQRGRWLEALNPIERENSDFQVIALSNYQATRPDELSLHIGNIINVTGNEMEGWYRGEKVDSKEIGWFPEKCVAKIRSTPDSNQNITRPF